MARNADVQQTKEQLRRKIARHRRRIDRRIGPIVAGGAAVVEAGREPVDTAGSIWRTLARWIRRKRTNDSVEPSTEAPSSEA